jgi:dipeptidyl-peptidase 4
VARPPSSLPLDAFSAHASGNSDLTSTTGSVSGALNTEVHEIMWHDASTGTESTLVSCQQLTPIGEMAPLAVDDYTVADDCSRVLIFTKSMKVWRLKTKGSYWILDLKLPAGSPGSLRQLGVGLDPSAPNATAQELKFASFSPDLNSIAYVFQNNIYVEATSEHHIVQLTDDGSDMVINGTFDWVYEEEFGMYDGFRWSPDGTHIAYWQIDQTGVSVVNLVNNTDSLYPKLNPIPYPKCGETNPSARVGIVAIPAGDVLSSHDTVPVTEWIEFEDNNDSRNNYIADMCFIESKRDDMSESKQQLVIQRLNRLQNHLDIISVVSASEGFSKTTLYSEKSDAWIDVNKPLRWISLPTAAGKGKNNYFFLLSEQNGWRQLLLVPNNDTANNASASNVIEITPVGFDVESVCGFDDSTKIVYFIASPTDPLRRFLYSASLESQSCSGRRAGEEAPSCFPVQRVTPLDDSFLGECMSLLLYVLVIVCPCVMVFFFPGVLAFLITL